MVSAIRNTDETAVYGTWDVGSTWKLRFEGIHSLVVSPTVDKEHLRKTRGMIGSLLKKLTWH